MRDSLPLPFEMETSVPLAPLTTFGLGGPAKCFARIKSEESLIEALSYARMNELPVFILGGGSNLLVSDEGFDGLVLLIAIDFSTNRSFSGNDDTVNVVAGAGETWDDLVRDAVVNDLAGIECMSGIPGSVGGTPVQNVGAYGQEVSQTIVNVRCVDREMLVPVVFKNSECGFTYRKSIYNSEWKDRFVVTEVAFGLKRGGKPNIVYKDLTQYFADSNPSLPEVRAAVLDIRRRKSMVIDPSDPNSRSAGSFFKNPVLSLSKFVELNQLFGGGVPSFRADDGMVKVPAAWLIEQAGFKKGYIKGNVGISSNHSLALINRGRARSSEIIELMEEIVTEVKSKFGIKLVPEPVLLGF